MPLMSAVAPFFYLVAILMFLSFSHGSNGATAMLESLTLGLATFCLHLVFSKVTGSFAFFLLLDFLSHHHAPDDLCFQLWYLDDGISVGSPTTLSSFLEVLQLQGLSYGLHHNLSKCEVF